jgi:hypothetical protein
MISKKATQAILECHFNDHIFCGDWCPAKNWEGAEKDDELKEYQCKNINSKL